MDLNTVASPQLIFATVEELAQPVLLRDQESILGCQTTLRPGPVGHLGSLAALPTSLAVFAEVQAVLGVGQEVLGRGQAVFCIGYAVSDIFDAVLQYS